MDKNFDIGSVVYVRTKIIPAITVLQSSIVGIRETRTMSMNSIAQFPDAEQGSTTIEYHVSNAGEQKYTTAWISSTMVFATPYEAFALNPDANVRAKEMYIAVAKMDK